MFEVPSSSGTNISWPHAAAGVLAGVGAGYLLGLASSRWLFSRTEGGEARQVGVVQPTAGNLVTTLVELTAEIARLRQAIELDGLRSRRSVRRGSTADYVSALGELTESDDEFFDPNGHDAESRLGLNDAAPNLLQLDELGKVAQENQQACITLSEQVKTALAKRPESAELTWRLSRTLFHLSTHLEQAGDPDGQKKMIEEASEFAKRALELNDGVWQAHQWYAIAVGSLSKYEGTQKKIEMGYKYKEHIDKAISLNPDDYTLHHLKGRFCFEVAGISWLEKKAAAALYGSPPESSYKEALDSLMKAEQRTPNKWKMNALMIAKCHINMSDMPAAVEWLRRARSIPILTPEDVTAQKEVEDLLTKNDPSFKDSAT